MRDELKAKLLLPEEGARVLCAVSGGADSMCLLSLLCDLGVYTVAAAHFEHGIRGGESLRDCAFVSDYCAAHGIPCFTEHADVPRYAAENSLGLEEAARELRYAFLERVAGQEGYDLIATAHNADDNAETMLLNLARGTSAAGLCGIPPRRSLHCTRPFQAASCTPCSAPARRKSTFRRCSRSAEAASGTSSSCPDTACFASGDGL